jgi:hypothetical protein
LIVAQSGLHLWRNQVRIFFCAFYPRIRHTFIWDVRSSEVQCNGGAAWMWLPRCLHKVLKVYNLLEESFYLCLDALPLLSDCDKCYEEIALRVGGWVFCFSADMTTCCSRWRFWTAPNIMNEDLCVGVCAGTACGSSS